MNKSKNCIQVTEELYKYILSISLRESEILKQLREETSSLKNAVWQISPDQGQFMSLLVRLLNAKKTLEIGVFTGYSSMVVGMTLPEDGKIIACDISEEYTSIAKKYWEKAGISHKIILKLQPALKTLDELIKNGEEETFDFIFIDADKSNYEHYFEKSSKLIRKGGIIAIDNTLWSGDVINPNINDKDTISIRHINEKLSKDQHFYISLIPIGDGLTLLMKK
jgi:predicted O-methyltransferase YrrM